jgi:hypothetical protein
LKRLPGTVSREFLKLKMGKMENKYPDQTRNLNPHKAAVVAMWIFNVEYQQSRKGSMDFWDSLSKGKRNTARRCLETIEKAPEETLTEMIEKIVEP